MVHLLVINVQIIVLLVWGSNVLSVGMGSDWSITLVLPNANSPVNNAQLLMPTNAHLVSVGIHWTAKHAALTYPAIQPKHAHHAQSVTTWSLAYATNVMVAPTAEHVTTLTLKFVHHAIRDTIWPLLTHVLAVTLQVVLLVVLNYSANNVNQAMSYQALQTLASVSSVMTHVRLVSTHQWIARHVLKGTPKRDGIASTITTSKFNSKLMLYLHHSQPLTTSLLRHKLPRRSQRIENISLLNKSKQALLLYQWPSITIT
jgi:hypothetical protein